MSAGNTSAEKRDSSDGEREVRMGETVSGSTDAKRREEEEDDDDDEGRREELGRK